MKRRALITVLCVAVSTLAPRVTVASDALPVVVAYRAPADCPNAEAFRQQLQRRLAGGAVVELLPAGARSAARAMIIQIDVEAGADAFVAQVSLRDPSGQSSPRSLTGPKCGDLIEALAFTAALSVEQAHESSGATATEPHKATEDTPDTETAESAPAATTVESARTDPVATAPAMPRTPPTATPPPTSSEQGVYFDREPLQAGPGFMTWSSQASAALTFTSPLTTSLSPGLALGLQFNATSATGWSPALGLSVQGSLNPLQVTDERASFSMLTGQAYVCPGALRSEPWVARLCGVFQLGTIHGQGENLDHRATTNARQSGAGLVLAAHYYLSPALFLGGQIGALVALDYHRFEVGVAREVVAETRTVAPWLALEVGTAL